MSDSLQSGPAICYVLANPSDAPAPGEPAWWTERRRGYGAGLRASVQSLRRRHEMLPPVLLLRSHPGPTLADVDDVLPIDLRGYADIPVRSSYYGREIYYKLEAFRRRDRRRLVYLDCDTVVVGDISPLWDMDLYTDRAVYAMRETADMGGAPDVVDRFNSGVMVINPPLLPAGAFDRLIALARESRGHSGGEQGILNQYFEEQPHPIVDTLDAAYNVMVTRRHQPDWEQARRGARILHFVNHLKPWHLDHAQDPLFDAGLKQLWDDAYSSLPRPTVLVDEGVVQGGPPT